MHQRHPQQSRRRQQSPPARTATRGAAPYIYARTCAADTDSQPDCEQVLVAGGRGAGGEGQDAERCVGQGRRD
jgi:hypothetical protein